MAKIAEPICPVRGHTEGMKNPIYVNEMAKDSKYQFVFCPSTWVLKSDKSYDSFIVCELEGLELLD